MKPSKTDCEKQRERERERERRSCDEAILAATAVAASAADK